MHSQFSIQSFCISILGISFISKIFITWFFIFIGIMLYSFIKLIYGEIKMKKANTPKPNHSSIIERSFKFMKKRESKSLVFSTYIIIIFLAITSIISISFGSLLNLSDGMEDDIKIPVLMYHNITNLYTGDYAVSTEDFDAQMKYLKDNNYKTLTMKQYKDIMTEKKSVRNDLFNTRQYNKVIEKMKRDDKLILDKDIYSKLISNLQEYKDFLIKKRSVRKHNPEQKYVLITFDDGRANQLDNAIPILAKYNFNATFAISPGLLNTPDYLTDNDIKTIAKRYDIANHGYNHEWLSDYSFDDQNSIIKASTAKLKELANKNIVAAVFPYGQYNHNSIAAMVINGVSIGFSSDSGISFSSDNPFIMKRQFIKGSLSLEEFINLL